MIPNLFVNTDLRKSFVVTLVSLLKYDTRGEILSVQLMGKGRSDCYGSSKEKFFPPHILIGIDPYISQLDISYNTVMFRQRHGSSEAAAIAANLPDSAWGSKEDKYLPPVVARRIIDIIFSLTKGIPRICLDVLGGDDGI